MYHVGHDSCWAYLRLHDFPRWTRDIYMCVCGRSHVTWLVYVTWIVSSVPQTIWLPSRGRRQWVPWLIQMWHVSYIISDMTHISCGSWLMLSVPQTTWLSSLDPRNIYVCVRQESYIYVCVTGLIHDRWHDSYIMCDMTHFSYVTWPMYQICHDSSRAYLRLHDFHRWAQGNRRHSELAKCWYALRHSALHTLHHTAQHCTILHYTAPQCKVFKQKGTRFLQESIAVVPACMHAYIYFCKRAISFRKRALNFCKCLRFPSKSPGFPQKPRAGMQSGHTCMRRVHFCQRAIWYRKRAPDFRQRALGFRKGCMLVCVRGTHACVHIFPPKSHAISKKRPRFSQRLHVCMGSTQACVRTYISAKEPWNFAKRALYCRTRALVCSQNALDFRNDGMLACNRDTCVCVTYISTKEPYDSTKEP